MRGNFFTFEHALRTAGQDYSRGMKVPLRSCVHCGGARGDATSFRTGRKGLERMETAEMLQSSKCIIDAGTSSTCTASRFVIPDMIISGSLGWVRVSGKLLDCYESWHQTNLK